MKPPTRFDLLVSLASIGLITAIYWQVQAHEFVGYDDPLYVTENPFVQKGLTVQGIKWAFVHGDEPGYRTPLAWLTHMADVSLFGVDSAAHHRTNVLLHVINALLVYFVLLGLTGARWRSAIVAMFWAVHPQHVESVAWIAERKDVLCAMFFLLTIDAYRRYAQRPNVRRYAIVLACFVLALLSKPMAVTLPGVLLVLDYWPLKRAEKVGRLLLEKLPFVACSLAWALVTVQSTRTSGSVASIAHFSFTFRLSNAIVSMGRYLAKTFWPTDLVVFYPMPSHWSGSIVALCALVVLAITALALLLRRDYPYLLASWLWFCGMLLPVIGLLQAGRQAMADRYMYLPHVGLFVSIVWLASDLASRSRATRDSLAAIASIALIAFSITSFVQVRYWQNTETLFAHALQASDDNEVAMIQIGNIMARRNQLADAESLYRRAIRIAPEYTLAHQNLGNLLVRQRRFDEAVDHFRVATTGKPGEIAKAYLGLGSALSGSKHYAEADEAFAKVVGLEPHLAAAHVAWGISYKERGEIKSALAQFRAALEIDPRNPVARHELELLTTTKPATTQSSAGAATQDRPPRQQ